MKTRENISHLLSLDLATYFFLKSALFGTDRVNEWVCGSGGYMILYKMQMAREIIPHMPWFGFGSMLSVDRGHFIQLCGQWQNYLLNCPKTQSLVYWWTDNSKVKQMILCFISREKKIDAGIQMGLLWKLTSKMVIEWVIPRLEWQIMKYKGKWYFGIQIHSQKWTCHNLFVWGQNFAQALKQKQNFGYMIPFSKSFQLHRHGCLILNIFSRK